MTQPPPKRAQDRQHDTKTAACIPVVPRSLRIVCLSHLPALRLLLSTLFLSRGTRRITERNSGKVGVRPGGGRTTFCLLAHERLSFTESREAQKHAQERKNVRQKKRQSPTYTVDRMPCLFLTQLIPRVKRGMVRAQTTSLD